MEDVSYIRSGEGERLTSQCAALAITDYFPLLPSWTGTARRKDVRSVSTDEYMVITITINKL